MDSHHFLLIKNNSPAIEIQKIPVVNYSSFYSIVSETLDNDHVHCLMYYAFIFDSKYKFIIAIGDDDQGLIGILSHEQEMDCKSLPSLTQRNHSMHVFEREIYENFQISFDQHPWLKPIRFPSNTESRIYDYPFFKVEGEDIHQVGVGPVHAGIIEPGHFRFFCSGEKVLHLEIQLGYQHRNIEKLMISSTPLQRLLLAESIAWDTVIGHASTHARLIESMSGLVVDEETERQRAFALELERLAIHIGDTSALCTDVAYQLGQVVNEALRTTIINSTQLWCGNRFGKGLIRIGGSHYPISNEQQKTILSTLIDSGKRYNDMAERIYSLPSVLSRFDGVGALTFQQVREIGAVGMAARMAGLSRDVRHSHPYGFYLEHPIPLVLEHGGDVLARGILRKREAQETITKLIEWFSEFPLAMPKPNGVILDYKMKPNMFSIQLTEGWRGEICHCAHSDENGKLIHYKIKDPSFHNWFALALAVRNQEISDFPVCNKSFNLSYCGHDL